MCFQIGATVNPKHLVDLCQAPLAFQQVLMALSRIKTPAQQHSLSNTPENHFVTNSTPALCRNKLSSCKLTMSASNHTCTCNAAASTLQIQQARNQSLPPSNSNRFKENSKPDAAASRYLLMQCIPQNRRLHPPNTPILGTTSQLPTNNHPAAGQPHTQQHTPYSIVPLKHSTHI